jgi:hypothetical protein
MDGKMGKCPDWYNTMQAAKYLNVAPWELIEQSIWWIDKAITAMNAETEAMKIKEQQRRQLH